MFNKQHNEKEAEAHYMKQNMLNEQRYKQRRRTNTNNMLCLLALDEQILETTYSALPQEKNITLNRKQNKSMSNTNSNTEKKKDKGEVNNRRIKKNGKNEKQTIRNKKKDTTNQNLNMMKSNTNK